MPTAPLLWFLWGDSLPGCQAHVALVHSSSCMAPRSGWGRAELGLHRDVASLRGSPKVFATADRLARRRRNLADSMMARRRRGLYQTHQSSQNRRDSRTRLRLRRRAQFSLPFPLSRRFRGLRPRLLLEMSVSGLPSRSLWKAFSNADRRSLSQRQACV